MPTQAPLFSIVTVCLNPGTDLAKTVESVLAQDYHDLEYLIKDGLSHDGAQAFSCADPRVTFVSQPDGGIYDAMNQALALCRGRYVNFLNAGDSFRLGNTLSYVASFIEEHGHPDLVYVDRYDEQLEVVTRYPDSLTPWYLFRRPVCHQALFVKRSALSSIGGFDTGYHILADYDALVKLVLAKKASYAHCPLLALSYKDGGVSSALANLRQKQSEFRSVRRAYFSTARRLVYELIWRSTLPAVRARLLRHPTFRPLARVLYH